MDGPDVLLIARRRRHVGEAHEALREADLAQHRVTRHAAGLMGRVEHNLGRLS